MQRFPACSESLLGIWYLLQRRMGYQLSFHQIMFECLKRPQRWFAEIPMFTRSVIAYELINRIQKANQKKCVICSFYMLLEFWKKYWTNRSQSMFKNGRFYLKALYNSTNHQIAFYLLLRWEHLTPTVMTLALPSRKWLCVLWVTRWWLPALLGRSSSSTWRDKRGNKTSRLAYIFSISMLLQLM